MNLLRNILFFIAAFILIGHDIVPHHDQVDEGDILYVSVSSDTSVEDFHSELSHLFEHFQHGPNEKTIKYISSSATDFDVKIPLIAHDFNGTLNQQDLCIWFTNLVKQRFRDDSVPIPIQCIPSFSLRGPPSFC